MLVRHDRFLRIISTGIGPILAAIGYAIAQQTQGAARYVTFAVFALVGLVFAIRAYRMAVVIDEDSVLVRGICGSRRIARSAIFDMTVLGAPWWAFPLVRLPRLHWRNARGSRRRTPITAFSEGWPVIAKVTHDNDERLAIIQRAIFKRPPRGKRRRRG